jgi:cytochrome c oxidase cbb3-type subunit 3
MFTYKPQPAKLNFPRFLLLLPLLLLGTMASAQQTSGAPPPSIWDNPLALTMLAIILVLLLVIGLLANVVLGTAGLFLDKEKKKTDPSISKTTVIILMLLAPLMGMSQDAPVVEAAPTSIGGLTATTFWLLATVIMVELLVIIVLGLFVKSFLTKEKAVRAEKAGVEAKQFSFKEFWDKFNKFKPIEQETNIDLGHDYDGIRELDNRLPPWWLYGFYLTIVIAGIYIWRYHIAETAPLSKQEYEIAMQRGEEQKAAYLAKTASNVDENTVVLLTEATALNAGKNNFVQMCAACHGKEGQGGVGPNLTDDYWINGGSMADIFKTIKYGRPEKGMKSWQDDYSPIQIAQLASFIKSLKGTNPPNPKEKQGDLYQEVAPKADSTATAKIATN